MNKNKLIELGLVEPESVKKGAGRPFKSFKYGSIDIITWKKIQRKLKALRSIRKELVQELILETELLNKIDKTLEVF